MIFAISAFISNIFGLDFAKARKIASVGLIALAVIVVIVAFGLIFRACNKPPKLDVQEIQRAQQAIATEDRKVMVEILAQSDVREKEIDNSVKAAEEATTAAVQDHSKKSNQELADELNRRAQQ